MLMKKIITILAALLLLCGTLSAKEVPNENFRLEFALGDTVSTNLLTANNTTNVGVELSTYNTRVGFLAGAMFREGTPIDFEFALAEFNINPYVGISLWNNELLFGLIFYPSTSAVEDNTLSVGPYISYSYLWDLLPVKSGISNRLQLKFGLDYYADILSSTGKSGDPTSDGVAAAFMAVFSLIIPKVQIGVQYKFGYGWGY